MKQLYMAMPTMACLLTACEGILTDIYDSDGGAPATEVTRGDTLSGTIYVDASSWTDWYYIDLHGLRADAASSDSSLDVSLVPYPIPTDTLPADAEWDGRSGIVTYWYDIFGQGIQHHERRGQYATEPQPEPPAWDIALHRNNVRTHGAAACVTPYQTMDQLMADPDHLLADPDALTYTPDEMDEVNVWCVQRQMLMGLIGNQHIAVNPVLSAWLRVDIPPMPPAFTLDRHIVVVRFADGTRAALQLANHKSPTGTNCCLTIRCRYPI